MPRSHVVSFILGRWLFLVMNFCFISSIRYSISMLLIRANMPPSLLGMDRSME